MKKTCIRKTKYLNILSNRCSHIYFLQSDYSTVICVANSHCLQNVRRPTGGSEFAWRTTHSAVKFVFYKSQPLRGKWLTQRLNWAGAVRGGAPAHKFWSLEFCIADLLRSSSSRFWQSASSPSQAMLSYSFTTFRLQIYVVLKHNSK